QGQWPLYLYSGAGMMIGWLSFTNAPDDDINGAVTWIKGVQPGVKLYPGGFTNEVNAAGSIYSFTNGIPVLELGMGQIWLANGNLSQGFTNEIALGSNNKISNLSSNKLSIAISTSTGLFKGSIVSPINGKAISINGAVLQKPNVGVGYFLGTNQSG